jgi:hypothetical protein
MEKNREIIEVRYLETERDLVDFFELSPGELEEMTAKYPFPDGQTLEKCKLSPKAAADWYESLMQHEKYEIGAAVKEALRPPLEHEILSFEEVVAAEKLWHDGDKLKTRYDNNLNAFLHDCATQKQGGPEEALEPSEVQGR